MPRARSTGTKGALAALKTTATSARSRDQVGDREGGVAQRLGRAQAQRGQDDPAHPEVVRRAVHTAAVHGDVVAARGEAAPDLLDGGLEPAVPGRHSPGTHERDAHERASLPVRPLAAPVRRMVFMMLQACWRRVVKPLAIALAARRSLTHRQPARRTRRAAGALRQPGERRAQAALGVAPSGTGLRTAASNSGADGVAGRGPVERRRRPGRPGPLQPAEHLGAAGQRRQRRRGSPRTARCALLGGLELLPVAATSSAPSRPPSPRRRRRRAGAGCTSLATMPAATSSMPNGAAGPPARSGRGRRPAAAGRRAPRAGGRGRRSRRPR